jgi:hypothetical protein
MSSFQSPAWISIFLISKSRWSFASMMSSVVAIRILLLIAPSYDVVNHSTNSASAMAVNARISHGKNLSMFSKVVMGLPRNERIEN